MKKQEKVKELKQRGRKQLPPSERKIPVTIFIKAKYLEEAFPLIKDVELKFNEIN